MKKIVLILHLPPPIHGAAMVGKYVHNSALINKTFSCQYINLALAKDLKDIGKGGILKMIAFMHLLRKVVATIKREKPDLCYVTPNARGGAFYKEFIVVMLLKIMNQKVIIHFHNKGVETRQERFIDNLLYKCFFKQLKTIILSNKLYNDIRKYAKAQDVYICPNGIPQTIPSDEKVEKQNQCVQLLFLSNMMKAKGVWDLVEACRILKERGLVFQCHFVGKWSDITQQSFECVTIEKQIDDVVFAHGARYGEEKLCFLKQGNIFILPTYNECFPLVLLEAMERGIPCIGTDEGGIPDIIENGKTGYIVEKKKPQKLADKIAYLIEHPEIRMTMGKAGRDKFLKEFTIERFENRMTEILNSVLTTVE